MRGPYKPRARLGEPHATVALLPHDAVAGPASPWGRPFPPVASCCAELGLAHRLSSRLHASPWAGRAGVPCSLPAARSQLLFTDTSRWKCGRLRGAGGRCGLGELREACLPRGRSRPPTVGAATWSALRRSGGEEVLLRLGHIACMDTQGSSMRINCCGPTPSWPPSPCPPRYLINSRLATVDRYTK